MASIREQILAQSFARLTATPFAGVTAGNVRRTHLTKVNRDRVPAIHQRDGRDDKRAGAPGSRNVCSQPRDIEWTISIFTRGDDTAHLVADALMLEVLARMSSQVAPWGKGITVEYGAIDYDNEVADDDAVRLDIAFAADYATPEWQLDVLG